MKRIKKGELYQHLSGFLKRKGIELHEGAYTGRIQQGCRILTDAINATQTTVDRAKKGMDRGLQQMRQALNRKSSRVSRSSDPSRSSARATSRAKPKRAARSRRTATGQRKSSRKKPTSA